MASTGWTWKGNNPTKLKAALTLKGEQLDVAAESIMNKLAVEGATEMASNFEKATTKTGLLGVAAGWREFPGRHVTGHMIDEIKSSVTHDDDTWIARWGWPDPEIYFLDQEDGPSGPSGDKLPAAHALLNSFLYVREGFYLAVGNAADGKSF